MKKPIMMFFIIYIFAWNLSSCSVLRADELSCETFINEKICKMTPEEQEKWFLELFRSLLEDGKSTQEQKETIAI
jgi:hypothetical protein